MKHDGPALDKRKAFILATVVYEYIATAEPVGSLTLTQKYNLGVSSATIRNEMAELEAGGYLVQPHTSAGRIPSDAGYRIYVDELMAPETLSGDETRRIRDEYRAASRQLDDVIEQTTRMLGTLSRSLAFVVSAGRDAQTFRHLQLVWISATSALAVVVTSLSGASQTMFEFTGDVSVEDLSRLSNALNAKFGGRRLSEIVGTDVVATVAEMALGADIGVGVLLAFADASRPSDPIIAASGAQNLLDHPEFHDLRKLRSILRIVEEQKLLYDLVADSITGESAAVKIGHELGADDITECSLVTMPYRVGDRTLGVLAILGPRRMPYGRLMALAAGTADSLGSHLSDVEIR